MTTRLGVILLLGMLWAGSLPAAYITDKLVAGLYEKAEISDKPIKALSSGTPLEVVTRNNEFIKVRTPDGTIGWVEAAYLTDEKPARSMLLDLQAKHATLQKKLEKMESIAAVEGGVTETVADNSEDMTEQLQALQKKNNSLQEENTALDTNNQQLRQAIDQLQKQQQQIAQILQVAPQQTASTPVVTQAEEPEYPQWLLPAISVIFAVLGFIAGLLLMRHKIKKRFGTALRI